MSIAQRLIQTDRASRELLDEAATYIRGLESVIHHLAESVDAMLKANQAINPGEDIPALISETRRLLAGED